MPAATAAVADRAGVRLVETEAPHLIVDHEELVDAGAAAIAELAARVAAGGLVDRADRRRPGALDVREVVAPREERRRIEAELAQHLLGRPHRPRALVAGPAHEALGEQAHERRRDEERLDPHVDEARDAAGGVVRVDGREHEVTGERRGDRDLGRLAIADLADHDDVGIVAQERAQARRERQLDLRVDLGLRDALELVLDGILDGEDVEVRRVDLGEARVQGRRLARAGRAGDEHDAVRPLDDGADDDRADRSRSRCRASRASTLLRSRSRIVTRSPPAVGAVATRMSDVLAGHLAADAAVLRQALLGDVQARHDLHAGDDRRQELLGRALGLAQLAVDPVAHGDVALARLDVDVRRPVFCGLEHERVDPADDRRLVVGVEHVDELLGLRELVLGLVLLVALLELGAAAQAAVRLVDVIDDLARRHDHGLDRLAEQERPRRDR